MDPWRIALFDALLFDWNLQGFYTLYISLLFTQEAATFSLLRIGKYDRIKSTKFPRHFAWQPPALLSQTLRSSYLSHMNAAAT